MSQPEFQIQRIYIKDISFESPNVPMLFQADWEPDIQLDIDTKSAVLDEQTYEVVLTLTVNCKNQQKSGFLCEVQQAGIFSIVNLNKPQLAHCLGAFCPSILFPYARETVASLVNKGSFPPLNLAPVNFDALFAAHIERSDITKTPDAKVDDTKATEATEATKVENLENSESQVTE